MEPTKIQQQNNEKLIQAIREQGIEIDSVYDFIQQRFSGRYAKAYPILVEHLKLDHDKRTLEGILRALTEKEAKEVAKEAVLEFFYAEKDDSLLRWVAANALMALMSWYQRQKHPEIKQILRNQATIKTT